jgi:hypothetical protein
MRAESLLRHGRHPRSHLRSLQWDDDADSAAVLSAPLALARARLALQDRTRAPGPAVGSGAGLAS